jgi:hypothetical protein
MKMYQRANYQEIPISIRRLTHESAFSRPVGLILLGATLLAVMPTTASALTLVVNNDTMVDSARTRTNINYGASGVLGIKNMVSTQRTFAKLDLTALPQDSVISRATLRVFVNKVSKPGKLTVNTVSADWSEGTLTDNNQLALVPLNNQSAVATLAIEPTDEKHYINYDITALVQDWQTNPQSNFGIALTPPADGTQVNVALDSKESAGTSHPMEIEVAFEGPKGAKGDQGDPGVKGAKGDTGATGLQGPAGAKGQAGANGKDGAQGPQGVPGQPGVEGPTGLFGVLGPQGPDGDTGPQGPSGSSGISGYEKIITTETIGSHGSLVTAVCTVGKKVLGGGCTNPAGATQNASTSVEIRAGGPRLNKDGYSCFATTRGLNESVTAYAICAYVK